MHGLLFIIAPVDNASINELLFELRDDEYGLGDGFTLITSKDPTVAITQVKATDATAPPMADDITNHWASATLQDVEAFCIELAIETEYSTSLFVAVDEEGFSDGTCIIADRAFEVNNRVVTYFDKFKKIRVPWDEVFDIWCGLDTANTGFEDYAEDEEDEDGWHVPIGSSITEREEDEGYRTEEAD